MNTSDTSRTSHLAEDIGLADAVRATLEQDRVVGGFDIQVVALDGEVTIQGVVHDVEQKSRAEKKVADVVGVQVVHNALMVDATAAVPETSAESSETSESRQGHRARRRW